MYEVTIYFCFNSIGRNRIGTVRRVVRLALWPQRPGTRPFR